MLTTTAAELLPGDVWLGSWSDVTIDAVGEGDLLVLPEDPYAVNSPQVEIRLVRITGRITAGRDRRTGTFTWSLRPDQTIEIQRRSAT